MHAVGLEEIRRKVEAGDRLSGEELTCLEDAAQADSGPTLKLALAHALLNAEANREALELVRGLRRNFPKDLQVALGYGRALVALERWRDAELALRAALALSPEDPEALKGMAVLHLRRGERQRASALVAEVRAMDPFDDEARLLEAELNAVEIDPRSAPAARSGKSSRAELVSALLRALEDRGVRHLRRGSELWIKMEGGGVGRLEIASLHQTYLDEGRDLEGAVAAMADELAGASYLPRTGKRLRERVMPVLRPAGFDEQASGALRRDGPAGLGIFYVLDDPDLVRYVPEGALGALGLTFEQVDEAAWANLEKRPANPRPVIVSRGAPRLAPEPHGVWALCEGDGYDGARLLSRLQQDRMAEPLGAGPWRVALGRRELILVCRDEDESAREQLDALLAAPDGIPGAFRLEPGGTLRRLG